MERNWLTKELPLFTSVMRSLVPRHCCSDDPISECFPSRIVTLLHVLLISADDWSLFVPCVPAHICDKEDVRSDLRPADSSPISRKFKIIRGHVSRTLAEMRGRKFLRRFLWTIDFVSRSVTGVNSFFDYNITLLAMSLVCSSCEYVDGRPNRQSRRHRCQNLHLDSPYAAD